MFLKHWDLGVEIPGRCDPGYRAVPSRESVILGPDPESH